MNLLEHYIIKILSQEDIPGRNIDLGDGDFYFLKEHKKVEFLVNCCGQESIITECYFSEKDFENDMLKGYILR